MVLGRVEGLDACLSDAVLAPELVPFRAVLRVRICHHIAAAAAAQNHDPSHFVVDQLFLVACNIYVARFDDDVAGLAVVERV